MAEASIANLDCASPQGPQPNFGAPDVENNNDYLVSANVSRKEIIDAVSKRLNERERIFKLRFRLFRDVKKMQKEPTSTFVTLPKDEAGNQYKGQVLVSTDELRFEEVCLELPKTNDFVPEEVITTSGVKEAITSIEVLPNELLENIFSFLDIKQRIRSELVCKRWRLIGKELPWRNVTKFYFIYLPKKPAFCTPNDFSAIVLDSVLSRCGPCVKQIFLSNRYRLQTLGLRQKLVETIVQYCPGLVAVELDFRVTNLCLATLAEGCPKLKWVNIRCFNNDCNAGMLCIAKQCGNLERLSLFDLPSAGDFLDFINPRLQKLCLTHCSLQSTAMHSLMNRCNCLQDLVLSSCEPVDQTQLFQVCELYQQTLKVLRFHCDSQVPDFNWCRGLKCLRNLEELCLEECISVDDHLMDVLAKMCPKLHSLGVSSTLVTDVGLVYLKLLQGLKVLDISMNRILGKGLEDLAKLGHLEKVYLNGTWNNISEYSCCTLATNCPNFRLLDVTDVENITNHLVNTFCTSKKNGFFKYPVQLFVGNTKVTESVETCEGIELLFDTQTVEICKGVKKFVRNPVRTWNSDQLDSSLLR